MGTGIGERKLIATAAIPEAAAMERWKATPAFAEQAPTEDRAPFGAPSPRPARRVYPVRGTKKIKTRSENRSRERSLLSLPFRGGSFAERSKGERGGGAARNKTPPGSRYALATLPGTGRDKKEGRSSG